MYWNYELSFRELRLTNAICRLEYNTKVKINGKEIITDAIYLKDCKNDKFVKIIFYEDRFINVDEVSIINADTVLRVDLTQLAIEYIINR